MNVRLNYVESVVVFLLLNQLEYSQIYNYLVLKVQNEMSYNYLVLLIMVEFAIVKKRRKEWSTKGDILTHR